MSRNNGNTTRTVSGGVSLEVTLFIVFLVLKLVGVIDWSWWWVTAPLWIPAALLIAISIIAFIVLFIIHIIRYFYRRKRGWY